MALTPEQYEEVKEAFDNEGVPEYVWVPIMHMESGGDPTARNKTDKEDSRGLFQINVKAHPQWKDTDLYDPATNAKIAAKNFIAAEYMKQAVNAEKPEEEVVANVWRYGIKPAWNEEKEKAIKDLVKQFFENGGEGYDFNPLEEAKEKITGGASKVVESVKSFGNELIQRFIDFSFILIPLLVGIVIFIFTMKAMFLVDKGGTSSGKSSNE